MKPTDHANGEVMNDGCEIFHASELPADTPRPSDTVLFSCRRACSCAYVWSLVCRCDGALVRDMRFTWRRREKTIASTMNTSSATMTHSVLMRATYPLFRLESA